jgi:hypothetical protein
MQAIVRTKALTRVTAVLREGRSGPLQTQAARHLPPIHARGAQDVRAADPVRPRSGRQRHDWMGRVHGRLGTVFHSVVAEMLRTMWKYDHRLMPTEEAMVICREVYANGDITLTAEDRRTLAGLTLGFCKFPFNPKRIHALEARLTLDVTCLDGKVRTLKGQPDLIMGDPPHGLIVVDWKTGPWQAAEPARQVEADQARGHRHGVGDRRGIPVRPWPLPAGHLRATGLGGPAGRRDADRGGRAVRDAARDSPTVRGGTDGHARP